MADGGPHLVLVGLPGVGKSTVGRAASRRLRRPFLDLDAEIARRAGRSVAELFAAGGESHFRRLESELTADLARRRAMLLAPGGGWLTRPANVALLRPPGRIILLHATPETVLRRMGAGRIRRPLLAGDDPLATLHRLLLERASAYAAADAVIDTEIMDLQEVIRSVAELASALWQG